MKKTLIFVIVLAALLCFLCIPAFAADGTAEQNTVWDRCVEIFYRYRTEIFAVLSGFSVLLYNIWARKKSGKEIKDLSGTVSALQSPVVGSINAMIDGYNKVMEYHNSKSFTEEERDKAMTMLMAQNTVIIEMLQTVYANSKLPQGVKDIVNLKYANCLKVISDDEKLAQLSSVFRENVNAGTADIEEDKTEV